MSRPVTAGARVTGVKTTLNNRSHARPVESEEDTSNNANSVEELLARYQAGERDFHKIDLPGADLSGLNLDEVDLNLANLKGVNLSGSSLQRANLQGAILQGANLSGADLTGANLDWADMGLSTLSGADLTGASMQMTILIRARFKGTTMPDGTTR